MTLALTAAMTQPEFLRGESVYLTLELSNPGPDPVELSSPIAAGRCFYVLTSPGGQEIHRDGPVPLNPPPTDVAPPPVSDDDDAPDVPEPPRPRSLAPGERWKGSVPLNNLFEFEATGSYRIQAFCAWDAVRVDSQPQQFRLEDMDVLQWSRGSGGALEHGQASLLVLRTKGEGRALFYCPVTLGGGRTAEPSVGDPFELFTLPKEAVDPVQTSTPSNILLSWSFWREGNTLFGIRGASDAARKTALPGTVQRLIEPALLDGGSITHLYAISIKDGAPKLLVVQVMDYLGDGFQPERVLAELPLDAAPLGSAVEADTLQDQPRRSLAFGRIEGQVPRVDWASYLGSAVPDKLRSHVWKKSPAAEAIPDARPAILPLREGGLRIAWLVREAGQPARGLLCEATFEASGDLKSESTTGLEAGAPIRAARATYVNAAPLVALWTEDGKVRGGAPATLKDVVKKSSGRVPPTFFLLRRNAWVPDFDPVKGIVLVPVK